MEKNYYNYHITSNGLVYSYERNKYLKPSKQIVKGKETGYLCQTLLIEGKVKRFYIHRLVAIIYITNPSNKPWVNHKDGNRSNNDVSNLEWSTISENIKHSYNVLGRVAKGRILGFTHNENTRLKMSNAKKGINHPKFKGYYCFVDPETNETIKTSTPSELQVITNATCSIITIIRMCKNNKKGYYFEPYSMNQY